MMALRMDSRERVGAGELFFQVEEAYAEFLFQDLRSEYECETEEDLNHNEE